MGNVTKMPLRHQVWEHRKSEVDHSTGEVTHETAYSKSKVSVEPPFIKVYIRDIGTMAGLNPCQCALLHELAMLIDYEGMISLTTLKRRRIIAALGTSEKTFRNYISILVGKGLLIRHSSSDYEANPCFFARGEWKDIQARQQDFELRICYHQDGSRDVSTRGVDPHEEGEDS